MHVHAMVRKFSQFPDMKKTQTHHGQILEDHKLPQKVRDHNMYILPKIATKLTKLYQKWKTNKQIGTYF